MTRKLTATQHRDVLDEVVDAINAHSIVIVGMAQVCTTSEGKKERKDRKRKKKRRRRREKRCLLLLCRTPLSRSPGTYSRSKSLTLNIWNMDLTSPSGVCLFVPLSSVLLFLNNPSFTTLILSESLSSFHSYLSIRS